MKRGKSKIPIIGITMGDPAGVGPEVTVRLLTQRKLSRICRPIILGVPAVIQDAVRLFAPHVQVRIIQWVKDAQFADGILNVFNTSTGEPGEYQPGQLSAAAGQMAFEAILKGIQLALKNEIQALVTNPIHKEAINLAGHHFSGHTEILAHYTRSKEVSMLLVHKHLRIAHVTTHIPLKKVSESIRRERVFRVIQLLHQACQWFGIPHPRLGVSGLNPHASDGGLFGNEEELEIKPAIEQARRSGIDAVGPVSPDALYSQLKDGLYDGCVAMYHDQGHIPFKLLTFSWDKASRQVVKMKGVNVTLGLPIIRTSVDHGTAFDIAWQGVAQTGPLYEAISVAAQMARMKQAHLEQ